MVLVQGSDNNGTLWLAQVKEKKGEGWGAYSMGSLTFHGIWVALNEGSHLVTLRRYERGKVVRELIIDRVLIDQFYLMQVEVLKLFKAMFS